MSMGQNQRADAPSAKVVKSAVRVLEILEFFDEVRAPANVVAVASALGYPQSSTSALLRSMVATGYLHFDARNRTYRPSDRVPLLGNWISPSLFREGTLYRLTRALGRRTGQRVVVATRNGDVSRVIHIAEPGEVEHPPLHIGDTRPLGRCASGWALLALMPDGDVRRVFHRLNAEATDPEQVVRIPDLLATLQAVRTSGHSFATDRDNPDLGVIAAALPAGTATAPLAVALHGPLATLEARRAEFAQILLEEIRLATGGGEQPRPAIETDRRRMEAAIETAAAVAEPASVSPAAAAPVRLVAFDRRAQRLGPGGIPRRATASMV